MTLDARGNPSPGSPAMWRHVTAYLPDELWDWLEAYLATEGAISLSGLVRLGLAAELARRYPEGEP